MNNLTVVITLLLSLNSLLLQAQSKFIDDGAPLLVVVAGNQSRDTQALSEDLRQILPTIDEAYDDGDLVLVVGGEKPTELLGIASSLKMCILTRNSDQKVWVIQPIDDLVSGDCIVSLGSGWGYAAYGNDCPADTTATFTFPFNFNSEFVADSFDQVFKAVIAHGETYISTLNYSPISIGSGCKNQLSENIVLTVDQDTVSIDVYMDPVRVESGSLIASGDVLTVKRSQETNEWRIMWNHSTKGKIYKQRRHFAAKEIAEGISEKARDLLPCFE